MSTRKEKFEKFKINTVKKTSGEHFIKNNNWDIKLPKKTIQKTVL